MRTLAIQYVRGLIRTSLFCCIANTIYSPAEVNAENWVFHRSYFSHQLSPEMAATAPMPVNRSAYRIPTKPYNTGGTVRWSWRSNRINLSSGSSHDTQVLWERSVEYRP